MSFCQYCGSQNPDGASVCTHCGRTLRGGQPAAQQQYQAPPVNVYNSVRTEVPVQYRPLGAWQYFGYSLLFSLPIVGFILLIVFSFNGNNINRRNFARSYFCALLIFGIIFLIILIVSLITGTSLFGANGAFKNIYY